MWQTPMLCRTYISAGTWILYAEQLGEVGDFGSSLYLSHVPLDCKRSTENLLFSVNHVRTRAFGADLSCLLVSESSQVTRMTAKGTPPQSACSQACSNTTLAFGTRSQWRDSTYLLELLFACTGFCLQAHSFCLHTRGNLSLEFGSPPSCTLLPCARSARSGLPELALASCVLVCRMGLCALLAFRA